MEKLHCNVCEQPTFHQTKNAHGDQIHRLGDRCLTCGKFSGQPYNDVKVPQKAIWRIENDEAVRWC